LITHDLGLVSRWADRVAVMYAGRAVETRSAATLADAAHPYPRALLAARPRRRPLRGPRPRLAEITGRVPLPGEVISGCAFADRCAALTALCRRQAPETQRLGDAGVACHHPFAPRREVALP
ncbi:oligopeptide/dipeptide ABC transporter ATP-binding protein, partial [Bradyrhizobium sp.]|uniref:oligopeptide/dipeptide ABC transporter ATP-binding protein n=1 Tax=Bradyrhizobium sp. TaxID=376 RepID=UPI00391B2CBE